MSLVADLHLHSHFSDAVSPEMTLENIAIWAQRKGIDVLGTGDCLQADWLGKIEASTEEAEPGFLALRPELEQKIWRGLPEHLRRPLRFVLSTEVCCAPPPKKEIEGIHHLIYFPSLSSARDFRSAMISHGHLDQGRPTLNLNSRQLLHRVMEAGDDCHLAPAHLFNPWFSTLGTIGGVHSLDELFGDVATELFAAETGLTSTPPMFRRVSSLDRLSLFSCSDAHSLENLGREYTVVDCEPNYQALFNTLWHRTSKAVSTVKFPLHRTRYYLNWCSQCQEPFDAKLCPRCGRPLTTGSRDRLEQVADRAVPTSLETTVSFRERLPLDHVFAGLIHRNHKSEVVQRLSRQLIDSVGHERYILMEAPAEQIAEVATPQLARAILAQRAAPTEYFARATLPTAPVPVQQLLF